MNSQKHKEEKTNFINRLKYAEVEQFILCVDLYKMYEDNEYNKRYEVLSTLKNKKLKVNNTLIEKYIDMLKNLDFEENYWSRTSQGVYKIGHDSIRLVKLVCYYDRSYYENINYYHLMGSICKHLNEISERLIFCRS